MVVQTLWPDTAPWYLNLFIWMAFSWYYILIGFVPAFYIAIVQLFGFPLLQRWGKEVVLVLHPTKVKFGKIEDEKEPYFAKDKCLYWRDNPLMPNITSKEDIISGQMEELKTRYEELVKIEPKTKKINKELKSIIRQQKILEKTAIEINPVNQIQIFTQAINQAITNPDRIETKAGDLLSYDPRIKPIKKHGIWIMQNPRAHFHRHYKLLIKDTKDYYKLIPVKERQQFGIGFWHSLGIEMLKPVEITETESGSSSGGGKGRMALMPELITTAVITQQIRQVKQDQNFSASKCYRFLMDRKKAEYSFKLNLLGMIDPRVIFSLIAMAGAIAFLFVWLNGMGSHGPSPAPTGGHPLI